MKYWNWTSNNFFSNYRSTLATHPHPQTHTHTHPHTHTHTPTRTPPHTPTHTHTPHTPPSPKHNPPHTPHTTTTTTTTTITYRNTFDGRNMMGKYSFRALNVDLFSRKSRLRVRFLQQSRTAVRSKMSSLGRHNHDNHASVCMVLIHKKTPGKYWNHEHL